VLDAFRKLDAFAGPSDIYVAGPFIGIGWGPPVHDPGQKISARWIGGAQAASIFVRVTPGLDCVIYVTIAYPSELERRLQVEVCGRPIEPRFSHDEAGRTLVVAFVPDDLTRLHDGRLWVRLACRDDAGEPLAGWLSVMRFSTSQADAMAAGLEQLVFKWNGWSRTRMPRAGNRPRNYVSWSSSCRGATRNWLNWNGPCKRRTSRGRSG